MSDLAGPGEAAGGRMTLVEHLAELRKRLIISMLALACGFVVCWVFYPQILDFLVAPYCDVVSPDAEGLDAPGKCRLLVLDPLEPFAVRVSVAGYGGAALAHADPAVAGLALHHARPLPPRASPHRGVRHHGHTAVRRRRGPGVLDDPPSLGFLAELGGDDLVSFFSPRRYLSFVVKMALAFGLGFEFPIVLMFGQITGIIPTRTLQRIRPWAIVGIVVVGAVITPTGDPFTLLILSGPMYAFYELSILFGVLRQRRKEREEREEAAEPVPAPSEPAADGTS